MPPASTAALELPPPLQDVCNGLWPTFATPAAGEPDYEDWRRLRDESRDSVREALSVCEQVFLQVRAGRRETTAAKAVARMMGWTAGKAWKKALRLWRDYQAQAFCWKAVVDKRHEPEWWNTLEENFLLPQGVKDRFKALCEKCHDCKTAHGLLLAELDAWRRGRGAAIDGYDGRPPPNAPGKRHPFGWSYTNLMRHGSTALELGAARDGREAALKELPPVRTTRVGSYPLAEVQFDDMWHDNAVRLASARHAGVRRILEIGAIDHYSGYIFNPGLKVREPHEAEDRMNELTEKDFRFYLAWFLTHVGWSPRGTVLNVENAKVVIREELEAVITRLTGGKVRVKKSGMTGQPALAGQFEARPKGNFRVKALKEGIGKLLHNRAAALPGYVGGSFRAQPARHHGEAEHDKFLMALATVAPELEKQLAFSLCTPLQYKLAYLSLLNQINDRRDHEMEGWEEENLFVDQFTLDPDAAVPVWQNFAVMDQWEPEHRAAVAALLQKNLRLTRKQKLNPFEVFAPCLAESEKLPHYALPEIVGRDLGLKKMVDQKLFDIGGHLFLAEIRDKAGLPKQLENGEVYRVFLNPFDLERLIVCDEKTMAYVGECKPWKAARRAEADAIRDLKNEQQRLFKDAVAEVGERLGLGKGVNFAATAKAIRAAARKLREGRDGPDRAAMERRQQRAAQHETGDLRELMEQAPAASPSGAFAGLVKVEPGDPAHLGKKHVATAPHPGANATGVIPSAASGSHTDSDDGDLRELLPGNDPGEAEPF